MPRVEQGRNAHEHAVWRRRPCVAIAFFFIKFFSVVARNGVEGLFSQYFKPLPPPKSQSLHTYFNLHLKTKGICNAFLFFFLSNLTESNRAMFTLHFRYSISGMSYHSYKPECYYMLCAKKLGVRPQTKSVNQCSKYKMQTEVVCVGSAFKLPISVSYPWKMLPPVCI